MQLIHWWEYLDIFNIHLIGLQNAIHIIKRRYLPTTFDYIHCIKHDTKPRCYKRYDNLLRFPNEIKAPQQFFVWRKTFM